MRISANLGFLWADLPLAEGIRKAHAAGFDAVETHFPHHEPIDEVRLALDETGLALLGLNSPLGNRADGDFGLLAVEGREDEARAGLLHSIQIAQAWNAPFVHAMAGKASGTASLTRFVEALRSGAQEAARVGVTLLIEPINPFDVPGYFLSDFNLAAAILDSLDGLPVGLMLDCYHAVRMGEDPLVSYRKHRRHVRHIQFAGTPDRREPDRGTTDYPTLLKALISAGYTGAFGAEYRPAGTPEEGLGWLSRFQQ